MSLITTITGLKQVTKPDYTRAQTGDPDQSHSRLGLKLVTLTTAIFLEHTQGDPNHSNTRAQTGDPDQPSRLGRLYLVLPTIFHAKDLPQTSSELSIPLALIN